MDWWLEGSTLALMAVPTINVRAVNICSQKLNHPKFGNANFYGGNLKIEVF
jgi:hypothetical protein